MFPWTLRLLVLFEKRSLLLMGERLRISTAILFLKDNPEHWLPGSVTYADAAVNMSHK